MDIKNKKILAKKLKKWYNITNNKGDSMAFRNGIDRNMGILFPRYIDDYISKDHVVRIYDRIIDTFKDEELGLTYNEKQVGNSRYNPRIMLKILIYSYSQGIRSSRKIEKALHDNISFMWLARDLKPDFKTISRFRKEQKDTLKKVLKSVIKLCKAINLINGNYLFIDGTKIKGNASMERTWTKKKIDRVMNNLDKRVEELLKQHEVNDAIESGSPSLVRVEDIKEKIEKIEEIQKIEKEKAKIKKIEKEIDKRENN